MLPQTCIFTFDIKTDIQMNTVLRQKNMKMKRKYFVINKSMVIFIRLCSLYEHVFKLIFRSGSKDHNFFYTIGESKLTIIIIQTNVFLMFIKKNNCFLPLKKS